MAIGLENGLNRQQGKSAAVKAFSQHASIYDRYASIHKQVAKLLVHLFFPRREFSAVWEIGCGTGIASRAFLDNHEPDSMAISDISQEMLNQCRKNLLQKPYLSQLSFLLCDGESSVPQQLFSLILSSFVLQWFEDLSNGIKNMCSALSPDGEMLLAIPTSASFPEWKRACKFSKCDFTAYPLPSSQDVQNSLETYFHCVQLKEMWIPRCFNSPLEFFRELKGMGAGVGRHSSSQTSFQRMLRWWLKNTQDYCEVHYHVLFAWASDLK